LQPYAGIRMDAGIVPPLLISGRMRSNKILLAATCGALSMLISGCAVVTTAVVVAGTAVTVAGTAVNVGITAGSAAVSAATAVTKGAINVGSAVVEKASEGSVENTNNL
jgi:hypothetical protein